MDIHQKGGEEKGYFEAEKEGRSAGQMHYTWAGTDRIIIDHTEVADEFRGEGVGNQLLHKLVDFARNKQIKVIPLCPFAKSVFDKEPDLRDVL